MKRRILITRLALALLSLAAGCRSAAPEVVTHAEGRNLYVWHLQDGRVTRMVAYSCEGGGTGLGASTVLLTEGHDPTWADDPARREIEKKVRDFFRQLRFEGGHGGEVAWGSGTTTPRIRGGLIRAIEYRCEEKGGTDPVTGSR